MSRRFFSTLVCCTFLSSIAKAQHTSLLSAETRLDKPAAYALIRRILPSRAAAFMVEDCPGAGKDSFDVESRGGHIILRGNNGVAIASALYFYLTEYGHCQLTWNGDNLQLPATLPAVPKTIHRTSPWRYRYYLNYCTFNYSMSWWDWDRWQREIDWMALHGINMPLAITGEEYTWYHVYREMGFTDAELSNFFCGPAYFAWFWMGNLDGWGGPLPMHWMEMQRELQKKILTRERELGMTPVMPAFTGHVPPAFPTRFPSAHCKVTNWHNGFNDTYLLDASDPLFATIGKKFLAEQTALFGNDHLYSADTFNENEPPSDDTAYLAGLSAKIYDGMHQADPDATWVMQGWLFYSDRKFWKSPQIEALLDAVPGDHMLLLDLAAEIEPVWKRTNAFYGKPWIWNMLNNFGGNVNLFGRMDGTAAGPAQALADTASGQLQGIGLTMEGIATNPVLYELMLQHTWQPEPIDPATSRREAAPIDPQTWLRSYIRNRYGNTSPDLEKAWDILRHTVYNGKVIRDGAESIITGRPTFDSTTVWTRTQLNYNPGDLLPAWDLLVKTASQYQTQTASRPTEGFRFDLVDLTRQVLANYASVLQKRWVQSYNTRNTVAFHGQTTDFLALIDDLDALLATNKDFLLGPWLADARNKGITPEEKALYERNARDLITLWGDANSPLHEYANRQWSGLLKDFYKPRWEQFFTFLNANPTPDLAAFDSTIRGWEWAWVNEQKAYPTTPTGNPIAAVQQLYKKYRKAMAAAWQPSAAARQKTYDIRRYKAIGDGRTDNTRAIQKAIDVAAAHGGGIVLIPAGRFVTGVLTLRSHLTLQLDKNSVLLGSTNRMDYGPGHALPLLKAEGQTGITIQGQGTIDGRGDSLLMDLYTRIKTGQIQDNEWQKPNPWGQVRPAEENRPKIIFFQHCDSLTIRSITIENALDWVQDYKSCSHMIIDSINVESNTFWNNDGIDLVDCKDVRLTNSFFNADDDGICLKSEDRHDSCDRIYIAHCKIRSSASALKFGTASRGGFHHVTIRDLTIYDTYRSAIALEAVDGGSLTAIDIQGVHAKNTGNALFIRLGHRNKDSVYSTIKDVYIRDVDVEIPAGKPDKGYPMEGPALTYEHSVFPAVVAGLPGHHIENVTLENIHVTYPGGSSRPGPQPETAAQPQTAAPEDIHPTAQPPIPENPSDYPEFSMFGELPVWGLYLRHVTGITLKNVQLSLTHPDARPMTRADDANSVIITP